MLDMLAHLVDIEWVARITHHGLGLVGGLELAFAVDGKTCGRLLRHQPVRHGGLRTGLRVQQRHRKAWQAFDQQSHDLVGTTLRTGIEHQRARLRIDPDPHAALLGEGHGQQIQPGLVLEVALFLLAGLAAFGLFDVLGLLVDLAIEHAGRQHLGLGHEAHHPLACHGFDQRAVLLAARRHPAYGALLCGAALFKHRLLQCILQRLQIALPALGNAVNDHALKHQDS
ncbi:hypothetical protein SDC9_148899 [bioreactor metagenome]|uniref:Uncharacterized protein n=1 Tax=bioreactor metagenome TaxID=1076179 RepID=A0A645EI61_9ZZZZ